jgi:hypothetical protein
MAVKDQKMAHVDLSARREMSTPLEQVTTWRQARNQHKSCQTFTSSFFCSLWYAVDGMCLGGEPHGSETSIK